MNKLDGLISSWINKGYILDTEIAKLKDFAGALIILDDELYYLDHKEKINELLKFLSYNRNQPCTRDKEAQMLRFKEELQRV